MSNTSPLEKSIVAAILRYLKALPRCHARKVHGSTYGTQGEPDIDAVLDGRSVKIEVKRPGNGPTELQTVVLQRWRDAGALAFVASSVDDVKGELRRAGLLGGAE